MTAAKKAAAKTATAKAGETAAVPANKPADDDERARVRQTGSLDRSERRQALEPGQHPDRNHPSNLVEVEYMTSTRIVDGHKYGPFSADAPKERRMVPVALQVTFNLPLVKAGKAVGAGHMAEGEYDELESGKGVTRLSGIEVPNQDPDNALTTEEEKLLAAESAGLTQEQQLARRQAKIDQKRASLVQSGAIEGSEAERARLGSTKEKEKGEK